MQAPCWFDERMRAYFETLSPEAQNTVLYSSRRLTDQETPKGTAEKQKNGKR